MNPKILVFIPMYNCEKQITRVLAQFTPQIQSFITEILVVNNRSTDNGEQAVIEFAKSHPQLPLTLLRNKDNYGLGGSHKVAFAYACKNGFDYVIVLHGDDQGDIANLLPYLESGEYQAYDCFLGARFMKGSKLQGYSKFRTFGNRVYDMLFSLGTGSNVYDLGSGLNVYKTAILKDEFYRRYPDSLLFNYAMVLGSAYYKHKVKFFPICWRETDQVSNVKLTSQAITVLKMLCSYVVGKKSFMQQEHRTRIIDKYEADIICNTTKK
ncbi:glycosyltransferase family 2 protein [Candidatus Avelusimicrobium luingense]|uniref:glycosyltransferase family 2 protein n=1 Tax=Candidatus Avelusimicrobium luingense TaxID=3416211 RepID=UPI003D0DB5A0